MCIWQMRRMNIGHIGLRQFDLGQYVHRCFEKAHFGIGQLAMDIAVN